MDNTALQIYTVKLQWKLDTIKSVHFTSICHIQSNVEVTAKKLYISFTFIPMYLEQQLNVNSTRSIRL